MSLNKDLDKRLQMLLKNRPVSVDEDRLEVMRETLLDRISDIGPVSVPAFFHICRYALAFGMVLVMIALFVWQHSPPSRDVPQWSAAHRLRGFLEDEDELDHLLVLMNNFVSTRSQEGKLIDWEFYNRFLSGHYEGQELLQTFYEWLYEPVESGESAFM